MADIHQTTLPNGLRVVLCPDDSVPLVGVSMLYDVGSRVEAPGTAGFAHLFDPPGEWIGKYSGGLTWSWPGLLKM